MERLYSKFCRPQKDQKQNTLDGERANSKTVENKLLKIHYSG
jgi:hypothetical protein